MCKLLQVKLFLHGMSVLSVNVAMMCSFENALKSTGKLIVTCYMSYSHLFECTFNLCDPSN